MRKHKLEKEEQEILDAIESGAWEEVSSKKENLKHYAKIAQDTFRKNQRMNIRISKADLNSIKAKAAEEGIPYQTLVTSIIHKYVSGDFGFIQQKKEIQNHIHVINLPEAKDDLFRNLRNQSGI